MIPYAKPSINHQDRKAVLDVLKTDFLTQGPKVEEFEKAICKQVKAKYCITTNSATSALHLACIALGIKQNDLVYVSAITFVASANCAKLLGAKLELVDINLSDYNISIDNLKEKLARAKKTNKLPKLLIVTHMAGYPCDMIQINKLAKIYKFKVIEDASHAFGSYYLNHPVGNCQYSNLTVFSFHAIKNITTGEGGCIVTNSPALNTNCLLLRSQGISRNKKFLKEKKLPGFYYEAINLGFNFRLTDIQASLGISQLSRLNEFKHQRNQLLKRYIRNLKKIDVVTIPNYKNINTFFHLFIIRTKNNRNELFDYLKKNKIATNLNYIPLYKFSLYKTNSTLKNSEIYFDQAISLPLFFNLKINQVDKICNEIKKFYNRHNSSS